MTHQHHCNHNGCCEHEHHHEHEPHHEHQHHHEHEEGSLKKQLGLIFCTVNLLILAVSIEKKFELATWQLLLIYLVPYLLIGYNTLKEAVEGILHGEAFNEHFLMSVATIGALCIGFLPGAETEFPEAVFVMLFFQIGELFEGYAEGKSRKGIADLMDIRPDVARVEAHPYPHEGREREETMMHPSEVEVGSVIVIRPGEKVPLDGIIIDGNTALNTVALTGESIPREVEKGDTVISGCMNLSGVIRVRTTKSFGESTVSKIINLVENASEHKSKSEAFITKFARIYTPIVVFAALAIAIVPPIIITLAHHSQFSILNSQFTTWLYRALMFLVVSCPCALVLSVPLAFFGGIGGASRKGILIKGANYIDVLSKVDTVVFDKTGTLTQGEFAVEAVHQGDESERNARAKKREEEGEKHLLHLAAHVEHYSTHPIGAALRAAFPEEATDGCTVSEVEEIAGQGIRAKIEGMEVCVGNTKLMNAIGAQWQDCKHVGTIIHVAIDGVYAGHIVINDKIKDDSRKAIEDLHTLGVDRTIMLTGDRQEVADHVARQLGITEYHAELLPADKVSIITQLSASDTQQTSKASPARRGQKGTFAFVGDGINDAPVLARADVGIAMGGLGSDAAIEAADVVIMDDQPSKVALAIRLARRTLRIAKQNIWFAIGIKVLVLILAALGLCTMWMAVFADVGVTILAVFNAMRTLRPAKEKEDVSK